MNGIISMPRTTNADRILSEARERVAKAVMDYDAANASLQRYAAALQAHRESLIALEQALAPKPRKKADPKPAAKVAENGSKPAKDPMCGVCYQPKDHDDHRVGEYLSAHEFVPPKAGRKAKQKPVDEGENTSALVVGTGD